MRSMTKRLTKIRLANKIVTKDNEGVPSINYGAPRTFTGERWPASSALQVETYGDRIKSIQNVKIEGKYTINSDQSYTFTKDSFILDENARVLLDENGASLVSHDEFTLREGDGVLVYRDDKPDYKVISIMPYKPLRLEIEKL